MTTAIKITLPAVKTALINAGFIKAEWRNRSTEKLWNDGFLVSNSETWVRVGDTQQVTRQAIITVDWAMQYLKDSDAPHINAMTSKMSDALSAAGIAHKLVDGGSWANYIQIAK